MSIELTHRYAYGNPVCACGHARNEAPATIHEEIAELEHEVAMQWEFVRTGRKLRVSYEFIKNVMRTRDEAQARLTVLREQVTA